MQSYPIIDRLGGELAVFAMLSTLYGRPTTLEAVRQWRRRGRIPKWHRENLVRLANKMGVVADGAAFRLGGGEGCVTLTEEKKNGREHGPRR